MNLREAKTIKERRQIVEKELGVKLPNIGASILENTDASKKNCENMIGAVQIPLGVAAPLKINGKDFYVPLATTEGALVASVSRGCKAITESGGTVTRVEKVGATRGPVFLTSGIRESQKFIKWLTDHYINIYQYSGRTSKYIKLLKIEPQIVGKYVFVRFSFDTSDAMGMNMVTIATQAIAELIEKKTKIKCLSISGNFCIDKKPAWLNFTLGRGYKVWAEVTLKEKVIKTVLKTTAAKIYDVWLAKCMVGAAISGSMGFNAQFANVIAAIFIACGQDAAHIGEGSVGITTAEVIGKDLYISVYLPDLMIGTIGGGTGLPTQKESFDIITRKNFPEAIGGAVLAGEISLLASLSEGSLVKAHERLGRGSK